jgi:hypothetical protein
MAWTDVALSVTEDVRALLEKIPPEHTVLNNCQVEHEFPAIGICGRRGRRSRHCQLCQRRSTSAAKAGEKVQHYCSGRYIVAMGFVAAPEDAGGGNATVTGMKAGDEGGPASFPGAAYNRFQRNNRLGAIP